MRYEKSCGAVIYIKTQGKVLFLIEQMKRGHFALCKGHVEKGETEYDTARREILEETNLEVQFVEGFRQRITYCPYAGCRKEVIFFLAEAHSMEVKPQETELSDIVWLPFNEAMHILTHKTSRKVLFAAREFMIQKRKL